MRTLKTKSQLWVGSSMASSCNLQGASEGASLGHLSAVRRLSSVSRKAWLTVGAGQTVGAAAGHLGRVMAVASFSLWPPLLLKRCHQGSFCKSPEHTQGRLYRASTAKCILARNSQTWAWKEQGGPGACSTQPRSQWAPWGLGTVAFPPLLLTPFNLGGSGLIIRNPQVTGTLALTLGLAKGQRTCQNRHLGDLLLMTCGLFSQ